MTAKTEKNNPRRNRRYTEEFKRNAVDLLAQPGTSVSEVAAGLGVNEVSLRQWQRRFTGRSGQVLIDIAPAAVAAAPTAEQLQAEIRRLHGELNLVTMQRDILKKACGILSVPTKGTPL